MANANHSLHSLHTGRFELSFMSGLSQRPAPNQAERSQSSGGDFLEADKDGLQYRPLNANGKSPAPTDKLLSCVSCRKRKQKCDRSKPKCGTCARCRQSCEYPERRTNLGTKRRNMMELESRLAHVETQLNCESQMGTNSEAFTSVQPMHLDEDLMGMDIDLNLNIGNNIEGIDPTFDLSQAFNGLYNASGRSTNGEFLSQELLSLGLQEPLPARDMIDNLHITYFETFHKTMPIIHRYRYMASLDRAPHMRPPLCLRYAIWTIAASFSDKYTEYEDVLYERARKYLHVDEMKGRGESFISIYYVQAWNLIATYEAKKTLFSRSWMSTGQCVRLVHMLGLHRLDGESSNVKRILPPPRDWVELEERKRAFWGSYYCDRWASSATGWPMMIDEKEIMTTLPSSEESFEKGLMETTIPLEDVLSQDGASKVSNFGGIILAATLFGHNFAHLHQSGPDENKEDLENGEFWKRHRKMDNLLSNTFMFLPDHLRLPNGLHDMNVVFLHLNIHSSTICLHQAAIGVIDNHKLDDNFKRHCKSRCLMAANEISSISRLVSHLEAVNMNSWTGFCLYIASGVFVGDLKANPARSQSMYNLEFILSAMKSLSKRHSITQHFYAQLELDIDTAGIKTSLNLPTTIKMVSNPARLFSVKRVVVDEVDCFSMAQDNPVTLFGILPPNLQAPSVSMHQNVGMFNYDASQNTAPSPAVGLSASSNLLGVYPHAVNRDAVPPMVAGPASFPSIDLRDTCAYQVSKGIKSMPASGSSTPTGTQTPSRHIESDRQDGDIYKSNYKNNYGIGSFSNVSEWRPQNGSLNLPLTGEIWGQKE